MRRALPLLLLFLLPLTALAAPATAGVLAGPALHAHDKDKPGPGDKDKPGNEDWKKGELVLLNTTTPAFLPGQQGWVALNWTATTDVCDIEVTASGPGITVTYPGSTARFSSLYTNDALAQTNRDYTAFHVSVAPNAPKAVDVTLRASYTKIPPGRVAKSDDLTYKDVDCSGGQRVTQTWSGAVPTATPSGPKVVLRTTSASVPADTPTWLPLEFTTQYAGLEDFRVRLTPPAGLDVVYPGDGTSSGLARQSALAVGTPDAASVRLQAGSSSPGTFQVPVRATWTGGSFDGQLALTVK